MLKDIINKILWHPKYKREDYYLIILHRGEKDNKKIIPMDKIKLEGGYIIYNDTYIPLHRVLEIRKKNGELIYKK
ncbi:hypothetical protein J422_00476 [Methanocaldococcus villosus KIN24-T80]|uniref:UPF0248 protein J422_00476 n=2 Tax=Methanocaldococcus villosus TaxID=667126 RepID=N6VU74_9EURY|nr:hypothetical protein J422_00476 [Methanocaldococcus villosus KIN24-T80]